jgi:hypothetical protein
MKRDALILLFDNTKTIVEWRQKLFQMIIKTLKSHTYRTNGFGSLTNTRNSPKNFSHFHRLQLIWRRHFVIVASHR